MPQTLRVKSHAKPVGHGAPAEQRGTQRPSTQAAPATAHWVVSEQRLLRAVHWPSTQREPVPEHCVSALQGTDGTAASTTSPAASEMTSGAASRLTSMRTSAAAGASAATGASIVIVLASSGVAVPPSALGLCGTHWTLPFESLHR